MRPATRALCAGLPVLLGAQLASAQAQSAQLPPASVAAPADPKPPAAQAAPASAAPPAAVALAQVTNPADYGSAFYSGAQAELVVPSTGVSALLLGYDAVWTQIDLSLGFGIGGDPVLDEDASDTYILSVRFGFPIHRGIRADYALLAGGGTTFISPPEGDTFVLPSAAVGAKFRVFMTPHVAVGAALGVAAFFRGENSSVLAGARPLGSASVVYFFR